MDSTQVVPALALNLILDKSVIAAIPAARVSWAPCVGTSLPSACSGRQADALQAQKSLTFLKEAQGPIFTTSAGERFSGPHRVWRIWQAALKRAGVRYRNPYQTRHTYASMMLFASEQPMWVAKQMGHADWTMIAWIYGRWMPSADAEAGSPAVEKFAGNAGK